MRQTGKNGCRGTGSQLHCSLQVDSWRHTQPSWRGHCILDGDTPVIWYVAAIHIIDYFQNRRSERQPFHTASVGYVIAPVQSSIFSTTSMRPRELRA